MRSFLCVVGCVIAISACGGGPAAAAGAGPGSGLPRVGSTEAGEQACSRDTECSLVEDCCGCATGGTRTAVRTEALDGVVERTAADCEQRACGGQRSEHKSCDATAARCAGGRCVPAL